MADNDNNPQPSKEVREFLQIIENEIVDAGHDELIVACERGTFKWQSVERARAENGPPPLAPP